MNKANVIFLIRMVRVRLHFGADIEEEKRQALCVTGTGHWMHSFLDIAMLHQRRFLKSRILSDVIGSLQGVQMELAIEVNSRN